MKKNLLIICATLVVAGGICFSKMNIYGDDQPSSMSREEILEQSKITDEELEKLKELGISYDDLVAEATYNVDFIFTTFEETTDKDRSHKYIFFPGHAMESGESTVYDKNGNLLAHYNSETDPNGFEFDEAKKMSLIREIKMYVTNALESGKYTPSQAFLEKREPVITPKPQS